MFGLRFRFIDDYNGYLNEPHGNAWGNLYFVPRVGILHFGGKDLFNNDVSETSIGFSTEIGYEFSVFKPVSVGTFFRWDVGIAGSGGGGGPFDAGTLALGGVSVSIGTGKPAHTRSDLDHDGVEDRADACPDTPEGSEVDARGCTILHREMVLIGIQFRLDSAEIEPSSERTLKQAAQALKDNPKAEVEIGGHTDDTGAVDHNMQLSTARAQSVADWLEANGIPRSQLTVKGYGSTMPKAANDSNEHRAQNRRIEFKRVDVDVNAASARRSL
jgi:outer membrane protein OmpA-like peptidoglycan-associated protein